MRVPERYICRVPHQPCTPQVTLGACRGSTSQRGHLATLANQHSFNGMALTDARNELGSPSDEADTFLVNARLVTAMTGMLNVLDCVAAYCHDYYPDDNHTGFCCFFGADRYPFRPLQVEFIQNARARIETLKFNGDNFSVVADSCKHKVPWWGMPAASPDGFRDIVDGNGVRLLRDVAAIVYSQTSYVLKQLGTDCGLSTLQFPTV